jgi:hypothetical protein
MKTSAPLASAASQNGPKKSSPRYRPPTLEGTSTPHSPGMVTSSASWRAASGGSCSATAPTALTRPGWAAAAAASASFCTWQISRASSSSASTGTRLIQGDSSRWPIPVAAASASIAVTSVNSPVTELISRPRKPSR